MDFFHGLSADGKEQKRKVSDDTEQEQEQEDADLRARMEEVRLCSIDRPENRRLRDALVRAETRAKDQDVLIAQLRTQNAALRQSIVLLAATVRKGF